MPRPKWITPGSAAVAAVVLFVGLAAFDPAVLRQEHYRQEAKKSRAQLGCYSLEKAIKGYTAHPANTKHEFPTTLNDLTKPPFGGPSFLESGEADLIDPWGQPYQMERAKKLNGTEYILVKTMAPDGTPISQFGIGSDNVLPRQ